VGVAGTDVSRYVKTLWTPHVTRGGKGGGGFGGVGGGVGGLGFLGGGGWGGFFGGGVVFASAP